jgi:hypothetical protein
MFINIKIKSLEFNKETYEALDWDEVRKYWPLAQEEKPSKYYSLNVGPCRLEIDEAQSLANLGVPLEIIPLPKTMLTKLQDVKNWKSGERPMPSDILEGTAVQITIPDFALLLINEVTWEDNCCTERLQEKLDDGWRILAVCPPNAQRRPDYILGRKKL